ncbi:MAG: hypothetical protein IPP29_23730 [Bacteroidetes bacterium]|nr:hypothetical protein [Bacteroidota bacterium]
MTNIYSTKIFIVFIFILFIGFKTYAASDLQAQAVSVANTSVGAVTTISFTVANVGTTPMSNFFINYKLNGTNGNLQSYPFTIQIGQSAIITNMTFIRPPGSFSLCAYVYSAIDINHANDTVCGNFSALIDTVNIPYTENFDGVILTNWGVNTPGPLTSKWEPGTPNYGLTNSAHSLPFCYDVNLSTPYAADAETYLSTPFINFAGKPNSKLDFWINYNCESGYDGAYIQYSLDNVNWNVLGTYLDVNGTNWYNVPSLFGSTISSTGWSGTSGGWQHITYKLGFYNFNGPVKFRFAFEADNIIEYDGFSIDNFNVYQTPFTDVEITEIVSPYNYNFALSNIPVVIKVLNNGTVAASNFPIKYTIDNLPPVTYTYTGTVAPLSFATISLPAFTSTLGIHKIKAYTAWAIDSVKSNDTLTKKFYCAKFQTLPVNDNLEGANEGWYNESIIDTATKWELGQPNYGQTSTTHSGTKAWDINLNTAYTNNAETFLYSPFWDLPAVPNVTLSFWMNMCTSDQLTLEYSPDTSNWYTLATYIYNQCGYFQYTYDLSQWGISGKTQFRLHFKSDNGFPNGDGVSIDDIILTSPPSYDFTITKIAYPQPVHQMYGQIPVGIQIKNMGASSTNSMQIKYELDGQLLNTYNYNSVLMYNEYQYLGLPSFTTTAGPHVFKVYIDWPSDSNHNNDTLVLNFNAVNATLQGLPYQTDFETTVGTWYNANFSFANNNWQLGTPAYGQTSGAHSGTNSWDINLNSPYVPDGLSCLYSPVFDFTNAITPKLKFWLNYNMDFTDGAFLQYSTNGTTWNMLGILNDPNGINWYNQQLYYFNNIPGWALQTTGWTFHQYDLDGLNLSGPVQFRYGFYSSQYGNGDGISLDDFEIELALQNDAQLKTINEPGAIVTSGIALNPVVTIRNNGSVPLTSLLLNYDVNNVYTNSYHGQVTYLTIRWLPLLCRLTHLRPGLAILKFTLHGMPI